MKVLQTYSIFLILFVLFLGVLCWQYKKTIQVPLFFHSVENRPEVLEEIRQAIPEIQAIWGQAGVEFVDLNVSVVLLSDRLLFSLLAQRDVIDFLDTEKFFFSQYPSDAIHVFLVPFIGPRTHGRSFPHQPERFCMISLSNFGASLGRTIAHEIGHLAGLSHVKDPSLLMSPGRNGKMLTRTEILRARNNFRGKQT